MSDDDPIESTLARVDDMFTEEALRAQEGKKVPLRDRPGGNIIGEATMRYDEKEKALKADLHVDDPKMREWLKGDFSSLFKERF